MKKQILSFVLGGFTFLCIGAGVSTTTDVLTVKPQLPRSVIHKEFSDYSELSKIIASYTKNGYIVKNYVISFNDYGGVQGGFLVMEKY